MGAAKRRLEGRDLANDGGAAAAAAGEREEQEWGVHGDRLAGLGLDGEGEGVANVDAATARLAVAPAATGE